MMRRGNMVLLCSSALVGAFIVVTGAAGCRGEETSSNTSASGGGEGGSDPTSTSSATGPGSGGAGGTGMGGAGGTGMGGSGGTGMGGSGGSSACAGQEATIYDVNKEVVGQKVQVHLKGVVAMSQKFLVTKSGSDRCLWGVFVSAPDVVGATTKEYSGVMIVSRGVDATLNPNDQKTYCPQLGGVGPKPGDAIPDDVKPGDVLNVVGLTDYFLLNNCAQEMNGSKVKQRQVSNACLVEKTGDTVTPPEPHVFTDAADIALLTSPTDKVFHDKWGNVKVRVEGSFAAVPQMVSGKPSVITQYGEVVLEGSNLVIGDKIYYRGYLKASNACYDGPKFTPPAMGSYMFEALEGFGYLNFCTWGLQASNKCTDYEPASEDCASAGLGGSLMCP